MLFTLCYMSLLVLHVLMFGLCSNYHTQCSRACVQYYVDPDILSARQTFKCWLVVSGIN